MGTTGASQTAFFTRLGIGVFDPAWWEFRGRLFEAVTVPSIARFCRQGAEWVWAVDVDADPAHLERSRQAAARAGITPVELPVQFFFDAPAAVEQWAWQRFGFNRYGLVRLDDDDALMANFLDRAYEWISLRDRDTVVTLTAGWEFAAQDRRYAPFWLDFGSLNTLWWSTPDTTRAVLTGGHHRVLEYARECGAGVAVDRSTEAAFVYTRHKMSDSSFRTRRRMVLEHPISAVAKRGFYDNAGIDVDLFQAWRYYSAEAPAVDGKTWQRGETIVTAALQDPSRRDELKAELVELNRSLVTA